jgi:2-octaprenyl-6-methoxyphenol hydroxylase
MRVPRGKRCAANARSRSSHGARLIFERLGVWHELAATDGAVTPITDIDISQAGGFGMTRLSAAEQDLPALGYVVSYRALQAALDTGVARRADQRSPRRQRDQRRRHGHLRGGDVRRRRRISSPRDSRRLPMAAAPRSATSIEASRLRQVALVAKVWRAEPHGGLAYERFTPEGPVALLPEGDHYGLVWTAAPDRARSAARARRSRVPRRARAHFGTRTAGFTRVADRRRFPLALEFAPAAVGTRCVMLGNAAQALHPVAGQGFNLGLRDAAELAAIVQDTPREAIGEPRCCAATSGSRRGDATQGSRSRTGSSRRSATTFRCCAGRAGWHSLCSTRSRRRSARSLARCCSDCADAPRNTRCTAVSQDVRISQHCADEWCDLLLQLDDGARVKRYNSLPASRIFSSPVSRPRSCTSVRTSSRII